MENKTSHSVLKQFFELTRHISLREISGAYTWIFDEIKYVLQNVCKNFISDLIETEILYLILQTFLEF